MHRNSGIIVIGGHVQGLGIARIFGKQKMHVVILDSSAVNIARHSKYCNEFIHYKKEELLIKLIELGESEKYQNYILFPTNDLQVAILSQNMKKLSAYFIVGCDEWQSVEKCYNKRFTYKIAEKLNIRIPETWMPDSLNEINNLNLDFPVIIKPAVMHSFYSKLKKKVFVCNNSEELVENYKLATNVIPSNEIIIQSIIKGGSENLYSACFLFDKDHEIINFVGRRARQHPPDFGNATTFAQIVYNNELIEISKKFLKHIGYRGVCEVEFMFDNNDNNYKLLEINPRTWKWHSITEKANIDLLGNYRNLLKGIPISKKQKYVLASFRHLVTDLPSIITYKLIHLYKKYPHYPTKYAVWDLDDYKPFIYEIIYLPILILKR